MHMLQKHITNKNRYFFIKSLYGFTVVYRIPLRVQFQQIKIMAFIQCYFKQNRNIVINNPAGISLKAFHGYKLPLYQQITRQSFQTIVNDLFGSFSW